MQTIAIGSWIIEVDPEATANVYRKLSSGSATACGCTDCKNWLEQREEVFPPEFTAILAEMGVDARKETELSEYEGGQVTSGMNLYWGEYLFIGRVLAGPECYITQPDGKGCTIELQPTFGPLQVGISCNLQWAMKLPEFPQASTSVIVFQVKAKRGAAYA